MDGTSADILCTGTSDCSGPVYKDVYKDFFFLDSALLGNSVKALLLISGFPLHFETGGKSALFSYFCTPIVSSILLFSNLGV